jgi:hypothetical protein
MVILRLEFISASIESLDRGRMGKLRSAIRVVEDRLQSLSEFGGEATC